MRFLFCLMAFVIGCEGKSPDIDTDTDLNTDIDTNVDTEVDTDVDTEGDSDTDSDSDTEQDSDVDTDSDSDTEPDTEGDTEEPVQAALYIEYSTTFSAASPFVVHPGDQDVNFGSLLLQAVGGDVTITRLELEGLIRTDFDPIGYYSTGHNEAATFSNHVVNCRLTQEWSGTTLLGPVEADFWGSLPFEDAFTLEDGAYLHVQKTCDITDVMPTVTTGLALNLESRYYVDAVDANGEDLRVIDVRSQNGHFNPTVAAILMAPDAGDLVFVNNGPGPQFVSPGARGVLSASVQALAIGEDILTSGMSFRALGDTDIVESATLSFTNQDHFLGYVSTTLDENDELVFTGVDALVTENNQAMLNLRVSFKPDAPDDSAVYFQFLPASTVATGLETGEPLGADDIPQSTPMAYHWVTINVPEVYVDPCIDPVVSLAHQSVANRVPIGANDVVLGRYTATTATVVNARDLVVTVVGDDDTTDNEIDGVPDPRTHVGACRLIVDGGIVDGIVDPIDEQSHLYMDPSPHEFEVDVITSIEIQCNFADIAPHGGTPDGWTAYIEDLEDVTFVRTDTETVINESEICVVNNGLPDPSPTNQVVVVDPCIDPIVTVTQHPINGVYAKGAEVLMNRLEIEAFEDIRLREMKPRLVGDSSVDSPSYDLNPRALDFFTSCLPETAGQPIDDRIAPTSDGFVYFEPDVELFAGIHGIDTWCRMGIPYDIDDTIWSSVYWSAQSLQFETWDGDVVAEADICRVSDLQSLDDAGEITVVNNGELIALLTGPNSQTVEAGSQDNNVLNVDLTAVFEGLRVHKLTYKVHEGDVGAVESAYIEYVNTEGALIRKWAIPSTTTGLMTFANLQGFEIGRQQSETVRLYVQFMDFANPGEIQFALVTSQVELIGEDSATILSPDDIVPNTPIVSMPVTITEQQG